MPENPVKVVIVGGGPVGIITAHALYHAGIDFVVLESRADISKDTGASLAVTPQNLRVFHQLGLLDTLLALGAPLVHHSEGFSSKRHKFRRSTALSVFEEKYVRVFFSLVIESSLGVLLQTQNILGHQKGNWKLQHWFYRV